MKIVRTIVWVLIGIGVVAAIVVAMLPKPTVVELASVVKGPLVVTVEGDGKTRIKDRFVVSAPVTGQMPRLDLHPGDNVKLGAPLTQIAPIEAPLLDPRSRAQSEAQAKLSRAARSQAGARVSMAQAALDFEKNELARVKQLFAAGGVPQATVDAAELKARSSAAELESARFGERIAQFQLETAEAAVVRQKGGAAQDEGLRVAVRAPIEGTVLRVFQESAGLIAAGAPLLELGDRAAMEIVIELLSTDAVAVRPDARVMIDRWGRDEVLEARVRLIEPSGFTKISALGIEEQRVNVVADFTGPREAWSALGDGYRVHARIVIFERADALKVPLSALFRHGDGWAVFGLAGDKASLRKVEVGRRSLAEAEILSGLNEGDKILVHPSEKIADGTAVVAR
jgi:HlyD family secretion protein